MTTSHPYLDRVLQARAMSKKDFYSIPETAALLDVQEKRVQRLITAGALQAIRTSPSKYAGVLAGDLEAYLASVNSTPAKSLIANRKKPLQPAQSAVYPQYPEEDLF